MDFSLSFVQRETTFVTASVCFPSFLLKWNLLISERICSLRDDFIKNGGIVEAGRVASL